MLLEQNEPAMARPPLVDGFRPFFVAVVVRDYQRYYPTIETIDERRALMDPIRLDLAVGSSHETTPTIVVVSVVFLQEIWSVE